MHSTHTRWLPVASSSRRMSSVRERKPVIPAIKRWRAPNWGWCSGSLPWYFDVSSLESAAGRGGSREAACGRGKRSWSCRCRDLLRSHAWSLETHKSMLPLVQRSKLLILTGSLPVNLMGIASRSATSALSRTGALVCKSNGGFCTPAGVAVTSDSSCFVVAAVLCGCCRRQKRLQRSPALCFKKGAFRP
jgi:hypothetical protein